jgi:hypothetical protein
MIRVILMATAFQIADPALKLMQPKGLPPPGGHRENLKIKKG